LSKVVIAQNADDRVVRMLQAVAEVAQSREGDLDDLKQKLPGADAALVGTWMKFNAELMDLSPALKVVARTGAGVDNVDVEAATRRGIMVLNTPTANSVSVAEHTVAFLLALSKQLAFLDASIRQGNFKARRLYLPVDIGGKTLGLIGCGNIGRMVAKMCRDAFNMRAVGYDPFLQSAPEGIELLATAREVLEQADYVSLHLPYSPETRNTIDRNELAMMKPSAFLINTSRGGIVNEAALAEALNSGVIAGAALDVFQSEPPEPGSPLLSCKNLLLTPHSAALTKECVVRVAICAAQGIVDHLSGRRPEFVYNKAVLGQTD
jgi:D-3-phosphoglycerate dehydrogenase / 2-oxoglutarate reductase